MNLNPLRSSDLIRATRASLCFWSNTEPVIERAVRLVRAELRAIVRAIAGRL